MEHHLANRKNSNNDNDFLVEESFVSQEEAAGSEYAAEDSLSLDGKEAPVGESMVVASGSDGSPADIPAPGQDTPAQAEPPEARPL